MKYLGSALSVLLSVLLLCLMFSASNAQAGAASVSTPLAIGETFVIDSKIMGEVRRINVYMPPGVGASADARLPVLYMLDGGMAEDFLHVAGLVQVSVGNGTMRPFLLVGIENTERRRDLTGPTKSEEDKKIAPRVGGSEAFRKFIRDELMPEITQRYRTAKETAIVGESLAGLFVVETLLLEPDLFDTYIAFDPSLWWNDQQLAKDAGKLLKAHSGLNKRLYVATGDQAQIAGITAGLVKEIGAGAVPGLHLQYETLPGESHQTIYHPAAIKAFRAVFKPMVGNELRPTP